MRGWNGLRKHLELYEWVGIVVSIVATVLFFAYGDELDQKQGVAGWHWHPVLWIWDIYRKFIPKALLTALIVLLALGWWKHRDLRWGLLKTLTVVRIALPFCVLLMIYRALNFYIPLFSPIDRDHWLMAADEWMFGTQPSLWLQSFVTPWLTDWFSFVYMAWFPMIFITLLLLYLKSQQTVTAYVTSALFSFYIGYFCYTLVPAVGPLYTLADQYTVSLTGGALTDLQTGVVVQKDLAVPRDVFPSLHTAISCVMFWYIAKYRRRWIWMYAPMVISILISTVYLRYHYVIDVIAGILLAVFTCYFGERWSLWWQERVKSQKLRDCA
jgi:membrane-associated phospholipid phosphatase